MPTRGTTYSDWGGNGGADFNPRAHEGHDANALISNTPLGFQSTCPRGARRGSQRISAASLYFNPRAHEGHDLRDRSYLGTSIISIHVPTRGTTNAVLSEILLQDFNPRAHEGHDLLQKQQILLQPFQSTCPRGARRRHTNLTHAHVISIHVPTRGTTKGAG